VNGKLVAPGAKRESRLTETAEPAKPADATRPASKSRTPRFAVVRARFLLLAAILFSLLGAARAGAEPSSAPARTATAIFAGGCFWCMEPPFDALDGVLETTSGYTGGKLDHPTYEQVSAGGTGHAEALRVTYDPARVGYERLLEVFWHNIDPLRHDAQFCDEGDQYRSAIFYSDDEQRRLAEVSKAALEASHRFDRPVVTEIVPAKTFYPAEDYHQDYYRKNPIRYRYYRFNCGRDARLGELWGDKAGEPVHKAE
jgi:peptide-methionine (S)-S-oxide reductase